MRTTVALLALLFLSAGAVAAEMPKPAEVLLLGVFHFDNPGLDYVKSEVPDVLLPARQAEIEAIVAQLREFQPTKILLEYPAEKQADLDARYAKYHCGEYTLTRNEIDQLGLRLARLLDHERVYATDAHGPMDFDAVIAFAQKNDPVFMKDFSDFMNNDLVRLKKMQKESPIPVTLRAMNDPVWTARGHSMYVRMARVGDDSSYVGAEVFGQWYVRNAKIFANIARLAQPGDRLLVIYGEGHVAILRQLIATTPDLRIVEASSYLK
jgi:hypothetical protein